MKRSRFTTRDGLIMLFGLSLIFAVMMWLMLSGILRIND
jgi:predicted nucleic acid-binding Zn ribbon protein